MTYEEKKTQQLIDMAEARAENALRERDQAREELAQVKRDIGWMMGQALISDIIMHADEVPCTQPSYQMLPDPEDTARLAWMNEHGRVSMGSESFVVAFDHGGGDIGSATLPTPYNIRHLIDLVRHNVASKSKLYATGNET